MYIAKTYPITGLIYWTRRDILKFLIISAIPVSLYTLLDLKFLNLPWLPIAVLGTAVAFVVGFKNNAIYDRVWEARKVWGGIVNASRSWGMMVKDFINNDHVLAEPLSDGSLRKHQMQMIRRHIAWMTAHRYNLRSPKPWEQAMQNVANREWSEWHGVPEAKIPLEEALRPYLDDGELIYVMSKSNKCTALVALQSEHLKRLKEQGNIWEFSYLEMEKMLVEFYTLQGKNERIKGFPYPRQFATLNFVFVWIFILLLPFGVVGAFDELSMKLLDQAISMPIGYLKNISVIASKYFIWLSIPFCTLVSWVFYTMERVGEVTENPFEGTSNDIPITSMSRGIEIDLLEMFDAKDIPEPIGPHYDMLM